LECPHCKSQVLISNGAKCPSCKKSLGGHYEISKTPLIAGIVCIALGYGASEYLETNRYSILDEFDLMNTCVQSSEHSISKRSYKKKVDICACVVENIQKEFSNIKDIKKNAINSQKSLQNEVDKCFRQPQ
jgi:hypothetical protein